MPTERNVEYTVRYNFTAPYLDGVYLAVNAVPDAYLVYDAHDCGYYKAEKIAANHDLFSNLLRWDQANRVVRTNVEMSDYIMGSEDKLSKKLLQVGERHAPQIIFVARSNPVIVAGHDSLPMIKDLGQKLQIPLVLIPDRNTEKDYLAGYLDALEGLLDNLPLAGNPRSKNTVALVGYVFDRNEGDHQGNVLELRRMLKEIGAKPGPIFIDGSPFRKNLELPAPNLVVDLTGGWSGAANLSERCGARYLATSLPLGIQASHEWLLRVAEVLGLGKRAKAFIDRELRELVPILQWVLPRFFFGKSVLIFADRFLLVPLARFLEELGFSVTAVGCTSAAIDQNTKESCFWDPRWQEAPAQVPALYDFVVEARGSGRADLIVGNSIIRQIVKDFQIPFLELGYPSNFHHCLNPAPFLGFTGVRVLVEQMINVMQESYLFPPRNIRPCSSEPGMVECG